VPGRAAAEVQLVLADGVSAHDEETGSLQRHQLRAPLSAQPAHPPAELAERAAASGPAASGARLLHPGAAAARVALPPPPTAHVQPTLAEQARAVSTPASSARSQPAATAATPPQSQFKQGALSAGSRQRGYLVKCAIVSCASSWCGLLTERSLSLVSDRRAAPSCLRICISVWRPVYLTLGRLWPILTVCLRPVGSLS